MAEDIKSLDELKDVVAEADVEETPAAPEVVTETAILREPVRDELGRAYATGKRKDAVARV